MKKIRAATLVESLVASAIIIVVFVLASLSLNNIFKHGSNNLERAFLNRMNEVTYLARYEQLSVPFYEDTNEWEISVEPEKGGIRIHGLNKVTSEEKNTTISR